MAADLATLSIYSNGLPLAPHCLAIINHRYLIGTYPPMYLYAADRLSAA